MYIFNFVYDFLVIKIMYLISSLAVFIKQLFTIVTTASEAERLPL